MKKKDYLWSLLAFVMVAMLGFEFSSCSKDDTDDELEQTEFISEQDPEGTIVLNMNSGASNNYYKIGDLCEIHIDEANNFKERNSSASFVSLGLVSGLGKITQIPTLGWANSAAVVPGTGYVMRYNGQYARIYVVEYLGQSYTDEQGNPYGTTTGAKIKYQAPFQLPIILNVTSLSFDSGEESQKIKLANPTSFSVDEKPDWCKVSIIGESSVNISVSENLTAEQRQGSIVLKNTSNSVKISVTQKGASSPLFQAGSGTADDPYQIKTAQHLKSIKKALNAYFILTADITLNEEVNGSGWDPIGKQETPFRGTIDGQGHYIKNMWMKRPTTNGVGLFGYVQNATITGIRLEIGSYGLNGGENVGGICGYANDNTKITRCLVKGSVLGNYYVGGICGQAEKESHHSGFAITYVGPSISECYSEGTINGNYSVSGIVGLVDSYVHIENCYSTASLTGNNCYGIAADARITKCYFAGEVSANGSFSCSGTYTYFDSSVSGRTGENSRTTAQMMTQSNYEGWDFTSIWKITEGNTYPTLRCFDN